VSFCSSADQNFVSGYGSSIAAFNFFFECKLDLRYS